MADSMPWEDFAVSQPQQGNMPWMDFQQKQQPKDYGYFDTTSDNAMQGATFGLGNRAEAAIAAPFLAAMHSGNLSSMLDPSAVGDEYKNAREFESQKLRDEMATRPGLSIGSNIGGALATGDAFGGTAAGANVGNFLRSGGLLSRVAKGAAAGTLSGAAYGGGTADYGQTAEGAEQGAKFGALTGGALPVAGAALSDVGGTLADAARGVLAKSPQAIQDFAESLKSGASGLYDKMRGIGAELNDDSSQKLLSSIDAAVNQNKFIPNLNPKTTAIINDIQESAKNGKLSISDLDQYRRMLGRIGQTEDGVSAGAVRKAIDDHVNGLQGADLVGGKAYTPQDLIDAQNEAAKLNDLHNNLVSSIQQKSQLAGQQGGFWRNQSQTAAADEAKNLAIVRQQMADQQQKVQEIQQGLANAPAMQQKAQEVSQTLNEARKQYAQASKYQDIADIITKADGNQNALRNGLQSFANKPKNIIGWSTEELSALQDAAKRGVTDKLMRGLGTFGFDIGKAKNFALPGLATLSSAAVPGGAAFAGIGTAARQIDKYATRGASEKLLNVIAGQGKPAGTPISSLFSAPAGAAAGYIESHQPENSIPFNPAMSDAFKKAGIQQPEPQTEKPQLPAPQSNAGDLFNKMQKAESDGDPNAKNIHSSASGAFQFTDGTWNQMVKRYGAQTGITVADKNDPKAQAVMAKLYAKDNVSRMQPFLKRLPTKGELYQAHVLGADGALRLINAANTTPQKQAIMLYPKAVTSANKGLFFTKSGAPVTAGQLYQTLSSRV